MVCLWAVNPAGWAQALVPRLTEMAEMPWKSGSLVVFMSSNGEFGCRRGAGPSLRSQQAHGVTLTAHGKWST
jgi:hypothetical protein